MDKGLEHLIKKLEDENKLEDTVIVLAPDHYPYGLSKKEYSDIHKYKKSYDKHKSGLIIYNSSLEKASINKYASNIDILPTLLNMFGIEYDSRLLIGKDIMSSSEGIVIFNDRSFITSKGFYDEGKNSFDSFEDVKANYVKNKRYEVYNKVTASNLIHKLNYYKYTK